MDYEQKQLRKLADGLYKNPLNQVETDNYIFLVDKDGHMLTVQPRTPLGLYLSNADLDILTWVRNEVTERIK